MLAMIGMDPVRGAPRFTFGLPPLYDGIGFIPVVMGLFGVGEILLSMEAPVLDIIKTKLTDLFPSRAEWKSLCGRHRPGNPHRVFPGAYSGNRRDHSHLRSRMWWRRRSPSIRRNSARGSSRESPPRKRPTTLTPTRPWFPCSPWGSRVPYPGRSHGGVHHPRPHPRPLPFQRAPRCGLGPHRQPVYGERHPA